MPQDGSIWGEMIVISVVLETHGVHADPGLLRERLKPAVQKDQPLADKLVLIPFLLLVFLAIGFMAADAARWRWSRMPPFAQWAGCGLLLAAFLFCTGRCARTALRRPS